jgi:hypothetical protein
MKILAQNDTLSCETTYSIDGTSLIKSSLREGRIREEDYLQFDGNLLRIMDSPDESISLKNET